MANSQGHLIGGTVTGVGLAILLSFLGVNPTTLFLGAIVCIVASEFPDIDHNHSLPRKILRGIVPGLVGIVALYLFFSWKFWNGSSLEMILFLIIPVVFLVSYEKFIPRHRGSIHKWPGLVLFISIVVTLAYFLRFNFLDGAILVLFGVLGFVSHILLDHI